ncbi:MAG: F0F1 ATP synthase subunit A [Verrucomicrobiota bacterium]|nr:F0F1 ATP synthase subunit A [Verrucomicrobiota bacterium]
MKRLAVVLFVCAWCAVVSAVSAHAQSPSSPTAATQPVGSAVSGPTTQPPPAAPPSAEEETLPSQTAPVLFHIGPLPVTNSIVCTWIVAAVILVVVRATTWKNLKEIPSGMQNVIEALVEGWESLMGDILDPRVARWVFPYATTFFIFIVLSNYVDLIPGVGSIGVGTPVPHSLLPFAVKNVQQPFFRPPTTDANLTVAMAGIFLVMSLYWAVRYNGFWGLIKHIFGVKMETNKWLYPLFLLLFLFIGVMELVSILFARPVALAMRLFGNIFAGETILEMTFHVKSFLASLALSTVAYCYETFVCLVQAFVFALLVVAFVGTMCAHPDQEHGH